MTITPNELYLDGETPTVTLCKRQWPGDVGGEAERNDLRSDAHLRLLGLEERHTPHRH
jgi:hypothetical protein